MNEGETDKTNLCYSNNKVIEQQRGEPRAADRSLSRVLKHPGPEEEEAEALTKHTACFMDVFLSNYYPSQRGILLQGLVDT